MQVRLPPIGLPGEPAVQLERWVGDGQRVGWRQPLGQFRNSAGRFPLFAPVRGVVRWRHPAEQSVAGVVCEVLPDQPIPPPPRPSHQLRPGLAGLVIAYVGRLPEWFPVFARSLEANPWLTVYVVGASPGQIAPPTPRNIVPVPMTLDEIRDRASRCFGFTPALPRPYKLCDLKPAYGDLFADLLADHDWFGWGDLDVVYGRLGDLLERELLDDDASMLLSQGSCCFCRNTAEMRTLYQAESPGILGWREAFTDPVNRIFDEPGGFHPLCDRLNIPVAMPPLRADINADLWQLRVASPFSREIDYPEQAFTWREGRLYREFFDGGQYGRREFGFIHLQKRRMATPSVDLLQTAHFAICPDRFEPIGPEPLTREQMRALNPSRPLADFIRQCGRPFRKARRLLRERSLRRRYTRRPA